MREFVIVAAVAALFCVVRLVSLTANYKWGDLELAEFEEGQSFYGKLLFCIIGIVICASLLGYLCSFRPSLVSADEYTHFVERKTYIESHEPESDVETVALGTEMYELNKWLQENQAEMSTSGKRYWDVPEGFMEETPIIIQ